MYLSHSNLIVHIDLQVLFTEFQVIIILSAISYRKKKTKGDNNLYNS